MWEDDAPTLFVEGGGEASVREKGKWRKLVHSTQPMVIRPNIAQDGEAGDFTSNFSFWREMPHPMLVV